MKTSKAILGLMLIITVVSCSVAKKPVIGKKTLQQKIESKDFTFFVDRCLPTGLETSTYNSDVILKIKNETAYANLPFHGLLSVNPQQMTEGPINFNGPMKEFSMNYDSIKGWNLFFNVDGDPYSYQVTMEISTKGKAIVKVKSTKRSTMTFFGDID
jgi:hypothetical protein